MSVRLALAEWRGTRCRLLAIHCGSVGATGEATTALRGLLKTVKGSGTHVVGVIPREQVMTRIVTFPSLDLGELAHMVELYAKAQLPYPRAQLVMDFHVLRQHEGLSTLAIVACQREVVGRHLAMLRDGGLSPECLTVSSWGVFGWYQGMSRARGVASEPQPESIVEPSLIVNIDESRTDLVIVEGRQLLSGRSIGQGLRDWVNGHDTMELIGVEAERSLVAIRKELPGADVRSLILVGLGPLTQWCDPLRERLNIPVHVFEGALGFSSAKEAGGIPSSVSPVVIGGVVCSPVADLLDLSPPEVRSDVQHRRQVRELVRVSIRVLGVFALGACLLLLQLVRQQRMAGQLERALETIEPVARDIQMKSRSVALVSSLLEDRSRLARILAGIFQGTPEAIALEGLTVEAPKRDVTLRGNATSTQAVLAYISQLEHLDDVARVELKYSTRRASPAGERTDFELLIHQRSPPRTSAVQGPSHGPQ